MATKNEAATVSELRLEVARQSKLIEALAAYIREKGDVSPEMDRLLPTAIDDFDSSLRHSPAVEYLPQGARLFDLRVVNEAGEEKNVLQRGRRYTFEYKATYESRYEGVAFGMMIKTADGIELAGTSTHFFESPKISAEAGQTLQVRMPFDCKLALGTYMLNCGTGAYVNGEPVMLHRILDGMAFRVIDSSGEDIAGMIDLNIAIECRVADGP